MIEFEEEEELAASKRRFNRKIEERRRLYNIGLYELEDGEVLEYIVFVFVL